MVVVLRDGEAIKHDFGFAIGKVVVVAIWNEENLWRAHEPYATTPDFLTHFGLESRKDLPGIDELRAAGLLDPVEDALAELGGEVTKLRDELIGPTIGAELRTKALIALGVALPQDAAPALEIAGYRVLRVLGEGGMGAVYEAENTWTGRRVALKVMLPAALRQATAPERFLREARAASKVQHPNIVEVFDAGQSPADGALYGVGTGGAAPESRSCHRSEQSVAG